MARNRSGWAAFAAIVLALASPSKGDDLSDALSKLSGEKVLEHIKVLASDAFEGPGPGHSRRGQDDRLPDRAVPLVRPQARQPGRDLRPGRAAGRLRGAGDVRVDPVQGQDDRPEVGRRLGGRLPGYAAAMDELNRPSAEDGGREAQAAGVADFRMASAPLTHTVQVDDSDVVFVGYGVVAPEYGWDDYKGWTSRARRSSC